MSELQPAFSDDDARNAIMAAALATFAERGFHGAGMRAIAAEAGVSQPLLNHHFSGKEGLWNAVGEQITREFLDVMASAVDPALPPEVSVVAMLRGYLAFWSERPMAFRFNRWRRLDGLGDERSSRSALMTRYGVSFMERAQTAGFIRDDIPAGLALTMAGGLLQFWLESQLEIRDALAATGDEGMTGEAFVDHVLNTLRPAGGARSGLSA